MEGLRYSQLKYREAIERGLAPSRRGSLLTPRRPLQATRAPLPGTVNVSRTCEREHQVVGPL